VVRGVAGVPISLDLGDAQRDRAVLEVLAEEIEGDLERFAGVERRRKNLGGHSGSLGVEVEIEHGYEHEHEHEHVRCVIGALRAPAPGSPRSCLV
jgi:hypothetical protein